MKVLHSTKHAKKRARERFGWNKGVLKKMMWRAFYEGIDHKETTGSLKRYLEAQYAKKCEADNIRIYGHNIYIFAENVLITVYRIPNHFIKILEDQKDHA